MHYQLEVSYCVPHPLSAAVLKDSRGQDFSRNQAGFQAIPFMYFDWKETWPESGSVTSQWLYVRDLKRAALKIAVKILGRALPMNFEDWASNPQRLRTKQPGGYGVISWAQVLVSALACGWTQCKTHLRPAASWWQVHFIGAKLDLFSWKWMLFWIWICFPCLS